MAQALQRFQVHSIHWATAGALAVSVINQAVMMVSGVLVARQLGADHRGNLALLVLVPVVLTQLGSLGLPLAVTYEVAARPRCTVAVVRSILRPALLQTGILWITHMIVLSVMLWAADSTVRIAGLVTLALVPGTLTYYYGLAILQGQQRFGPYYAVSLSPGVLYSAMVLLLWLVGEGTLPGIAFVWTLTWIGSGIAALLVARIPGLLQAPIEQPAPSRSAMTRFGLKGLLGSTSPIEMFRLDQVAVGLLLPPRALGLYVVALAFTNLLRFLSQSIGLIAYPRVAAQASALASRRLIWNFFWFTVAVSLLIVVPLEAAAGWLVLLMFGAEFQDAVPIMRIVLIGAVFLGARRVLSDGVRGVNRPTLGTIAEVVSWLWLAPALAICTPRWGVEGVAWAFATAACIGLLVLGVLVLRAPLDTPDEAMRAEEGLVASHN
jgi:O-antigen/teichoic acid export membrane protein